MNTGILRVIGVGPGDPELMTLKAARLCKAADIVAYFAKRGERGHARAIAANHIPPDCEEIRLDYPLTTEVPASDPRYRREIAAFYEAAASRLAGPLAAGSDVALLCEGDPIFYGSGLHLLERLGVDFATEIIPGVSGMSGCWARARLPLLRGSEALAVLPATLDAATLAVKLAAADGAVILKLGRNLGKVRAVLEACGRLDDAVYVERGTMADECVMPLAARDPAMPAPYFSLLIIAARAGGR
jgi:precorrin-2/cobalt-factor-2 C20-methyltransferase